MKMIKTVVAACVAMTLAGGAMAEDSDLFSPEQLVQAGVKAAAKELAQEIPVGPFTLAFGATDGGAGASFTGDGLKRVTEWIDEEALFKKSSVSSLLGIGYEVDAGWKSDADAPNNASFSLQPTLAVIWSEGQLDLPADQTPAGYAEAIRKASLPAFIPCMKRLREEKKPISIEACKLLPMPKPHLSWHVGGDFRYRFGSIDQGGSVVRVNQAIVGGVSSLVFYTPNEYEWVRQWPTLSLGFYTVADTESSAATVPEDIKADYLKAGLSTKLNLGPKKSLSESRNDYPARLHIDIDGSKATKGPDQDWQVLYKAQLVLEVNDTVKPAITYRDGEEFGLDFDEELLLGFVLPLLK